jgi:hypothetical protein
MSGLGEKVRPISGKAFPDLPKAELKRLQDQGFDSVVIKNMDDSHSSELQTQIIIFDPSNIRSVHAAFDPAKGKSADLLAGISPNAFATIQQSAVGSVGGSMAGFDPETGEFDAERAQQGAIAGAIGLPAAVRGASALGAMARRAPNAFADDAAQGVASAGGPKTPAQALKFETPEWEIQARNDGFDTEKVLYHGTKRDFDQFSLDVPQANSDRAAPDGVYLSASPETAQEWAAMAAGDGAEKIMPVVVRSKKPYTATKVKEFGDAAVKWARSNGHEVGRSEAEELFKQHLKQQGFDAIFTSTETIIFDPANIRVIKAGKDGARVRISDDKPMGFGAGAAPRKSGLQSAAVRFNGKTYKGANHDEAVEAAIRATGKTRAEIEGAKLDAGFVDGSGKFYGRDSVEAAVAALAAGQIKDPAVRRILEAKIRKGESPALTSDMMDFGGR